MTEMTFGNALRALGIEDYSGMVELYADWDGVEATICCVVLRHIEESAVDKAEHPATEET